MFKASVESESATYSRANYPLGLEQYSHNNCEDINNPTCLLLFFFVTTIHVHVPTIWSELPMKCFPFHLFYL